MERDQRRRAWVADVDSSLVVPSLDVPVPQMENQLVEVWEQLDIHIPVQANRSAQDLIFIFFVARACVVFKVYAQGQNSAALGGAVHVDIPVLHGRGGLVGQRGLQGFSPGQGSTAFSGADLVDIPVPSGGGLH